MTSYAQVMRICITCTTYGGSSDVVKTGIYIIQIKETYIFI